MNIKYNINKLLNAFGYQISKSPYSQRQINSGHFKWLQDLDINTIIDVGANEGQFIEKITKILPDANVFSFEPLELTYQKLSRNFKGRQNIHLYNFALGDEEKDASINRNEYSPSSSLLELTELHQSAFPETKTVHQENIHIKILNEVLRDTELKKNILLKIDVQGFELNVLRGAHNILNKTKVLLIETTFVELYKGQPLFNDVHSFLLDKEFIYGGSFEQLYDKTNGRILQADSIFIRDSVNE